MFKIQLRDYAGKGSCVHVHVVNVCVHVYMCIWVCRGQSWNMNLSGGMETNAEFLKEIDVPYDEVISLLCVQNKIIIVNRNNALIRVMYTQSHTIMISIVLFFFYMVWRLGINYQSSAVWQFNRFTV